MNVMTAPVGQALSDLARAAIAGLGARVSEFGGDRRATTNVARFDMPRVLHALGRGNAVERAKAIYALTEFMRAPEQARRRWPGAVRELATKGDFPANSFLAQYIEKFLVIPGEIDYGYELIFDIHDVATAEGMPLKGSFKTLDVKCQSRDDVPQAGGGRACAGGRDYWQRGRDAL
jgi:hypothetical protein